MAKRKIKILIVDDSDIILKSLTNFLEDYDFDVTTCRDGLEGIEKSVQIQPDIIFLDLMMPNLNGIKMLQVKRILKEIQDIPVVVISANTIRSNVLAAIEAGANKVISKPIENRVVIESITELLGIKDIEKSAHKEKSNFEEKNKIQTKLVSFFLNSFVEKKQKLKKALRSKNIELLKEIIHQIKGTGSTIGYPKLTEISKEVYDKEINKATDWIFAEYKINEIFQLVIQIEKEFYNKKK